MMSAVAVVLASASGSALAESTGIMIVEERYSITNKVTYNDPWQCAARPNCPVTTTITTTQQASSATPLERELYSDGFDWAKSGADTFSVSASAYGWGHATAETSLSFRVLQDATAFLTFGGGASTWSWGVFSLFDLTSGQDLYSQNFSRSYSGFSPQGVSPSDASFSGFLDSDHLYKLTLRGDADAQYDGVWSMSLGVSGLHAIAAPVPEPGAWALMLVGLATVGSLARRHSLATAT